MAFKLDLRRRAQRLDRWFMDRIAGPKPRDLGALTAPPLFRVPKDHIGIAQSWFDPELMISPNYQRKRLLPGDGVHPALVHVFKGVYRNLDERKWPFWIIEGMRSAERQDVLRRSGVSKAAAYSSPHQWGCAVDFVHFKRGWDLRNVEWELIAALVKESARRASVPLEWGGEWSFYDPAHWQLAAFRRYRDHWRGLVPDGPDRPGRFEAVRPKSDADWRALDKQLGLHKGWWSAHPKVGVDG